MIRSRVGTVVCMGLACAAPVDASAEEPPQAVRIEYRAPASCPDAQEFVARVLGRTTRARLARDGEDAAVSFEAVVEGDQRDARGEVLVRDREGHASRRTLQGGGCDEVSDALALVVALVIDPRARATVVKTAPPPAPARPRASLVVAVEAPEPSPEVAPPARAEPRRARWAAGAGALVASGVAPDALLGAAVFGELRPEGEGWLAPALRLGFTRTASGAVDAAGGAAARFTWTSFDAGACALAGSTWSVAACARVEAGTLEAEASGVGRPKSGTHPWLALGVDLRARRVVLAPLWLELAGGLVAPVERDRFFFEPALTVYEVPWIAARAALNVGASFGAIP